MWWCRLLGRGRPVGRGVRPRAGGSTPGAGARITGGARRYRGSAGGATGDPAPLRRRRPSATRQDDDDTPEYRSGRPLLLGLVPASVHNVWTGRRRPCPQALRAGAPGLGCQWRVEVSCVDGSRAPRVGRCSSTGRPHGAGAGPQRGGDGCGQRPACDTHCPIILGCSARTTPSCSVRDPGWRRVQPGITSLLLRACQTSSGQ